MKKIIFFPLVLSLLLSVFLASGQVQVSPSGGSQQLPKDEHAGHQHTAPPGQDNSTPGLNEVGPAHEKAPELNAKRLKAVSEAMFTQKRLATAKEMLNKAKEFLATGKQNGSLPAGKIQKMEARIQTLEERIKVVETNLVEAKRRLGIA